MDPNTCKMIQCRRDHLLTFLNMNWKSMIGATDMTCHLSVYWSLYLPVFLLTMANSLGNAEGKQACCHQVMIITNTFK